MNENKTVVKEAIQFVGKALKIKNVYPDVDVDDATKNLLNNKEFIKDATNTVDVLEKAVSSGIRIGKGLVLILHGLGDIVKAYNRSEDESEEDN